MVAISLPDPDGYLYVVCGSTKHAIDRQREIELPSAIPRHPLTKLKRQTIVDVGWIERIHVDDIRSVGGTVPATVLTKIQDAIRQFHQRQAGQEGNEPS